MIKTSRKNNSINNKKTKNVKHYSRNNKSNKSNKMRGSGNKSMITTMSDLFSFTKPINDEDLKLFYRDLMISEANHYTLFIRFARKYGSHVEDIDLRWQQWLSYEAELVKNYSKKETIHG